MNVTSASQGGTGMGPPPVALTERIRAVTKEKDEQSSSKDEQTAVPQGTDALVMEPRRPMVLHPAASLAPTGISGAAATAGAQASRTGVGAGAPVSPSTAAGGSVGSGRAQMQEGTVGVRGVTAAAVQMKSTRTGIPEGTTLAGSARQGNALPQDRASVQAATGGESGTGNEPGSYSSPAAVMPAMPHPSADDLPKSPSPSLQMQGRPLPTSAAHSSDTSTPTSDTGPTPVDETPDTLLAGPQPDLSTTERARGKRESLHPQPSAHGPSNAGMHAGQPASQATAGHGNGEQHPAPPALPAAAAMVTQERMPSTASVTVPFSSWGPGHQVTASWIPSGMPGFAGTGVTLRSSSERVTNAVDAALETTDLLATSGWHVQPDDASDDASEHRMPRRPQPEDDE